MEQYCKEGTIFFQQVFGPNKKHGWKSNIIPLGEFSFKAFTTKIKQIVKNNNNILTSPDEKDNQQYTWQVSAILWFADCLVYHDDTVFGKILAKMPPVSNYCVV